MSAPHLLAFLEREPDGHARLIEAAGGLVPAGYRLAVARLEAWHVSVTAVPTATELHVAVRDLAERGGYLGSVPSRRALATQAEGEGFNVLPGRREKWTR
jgi:hypothetical protein